MTETANVNLKTKILLRYSSMNLLKKIYRTVIAQLRSYEVVTYDNYENLRLVFFLLFFFALSGFFLFLFSLFILFFLVIAKYSDVNRTEVHTVVSMEAI